MYAELSGPLHKMLQVRKFDGRKGRKKKLAWTTEAEEASRRSIDLSSESWDYSLSIRTRDLCSAPMHQIMPWEQSWSRYERVVPMSQWPFGVELWRTWTAREKETYAIFCALRKWSGHIGLQPIVVCTDHRSLQSWHKEHVDLPAGPAARRAQRHETPAKFDLNVVYVPGEDNTVADCFSRWAYQAGKAGMDISMHGDAEETAEAKRIIQAERFLDEGEIKCFVVMGSRADLAQV